MLKTFAIPLACIAIQAGTQSAPGTWGLSGSAAMSYRMQATGLATDPNGATLSLLSTVAEPPGFGTVATFLPAERAHQRRVVLSGDLRARGVTGGASLWLRVDKAGTMLLLENGTDHPVRGDTVWAHREVSLPVPAGATTLVFGVLLQGGGEVTARDVRLRVTDSITVDAPMAPDAKRVLDAALVTTKTYSLWRDTVSWSVVEPAVRTLAAGATRTADVYPAIRFLLASLGDHHSFVRPPDQSAAWRAAGAANAPPDVRLIPTFVGYIAVAAYSGADPAAMHTYALSAHRAIKLTVPVARCGWVIDLRRNEGGNMWPMLAALKPFLGSGPLGKFEGPTASGPPWIAGVGVNAEPSADLMSLDSVWVAILTGRNTASSGEAVTIAFRGRPHTRSFGQPTAGLSTANGGFPLPDGGTLFLTTALDADRTGHRYGGKIVPDELVNDSSANFAPRDAALSAAVGWLARSSACGVHQ